MDAVAVKPSESKPSDIKPSDILRQADTEKLARMAFTMTSIAKSLLLLVT